MGKAAKSSQAQSSVAERRLRPIYDWLDNGNNKKALQEAEKVLKKQPDFPCCQALKALALIRLGRENEAMPILDSIVERGTSDESALQAMNIAYRELQQMHMTCVMYEKATQLDPKNEELLSQLFMSYVRIGAYKKQQAAAMALYKLKSKTPYYFWAVMSIVLQAKSSDDEKTANSIILPLAERMIAKMHKEGKMDQEQECRLYLMVLEMQQKYKEALEFLLGPLGQRLESSTSFLNYPISSKLTYQKKLENWGQVNLLAKEILQSYPDQWDVYLDYITSIFRLVDESSSDGLPDNVDSSVEEAVSFITFQKDNNPKCRGPYLAQIELHSRLLARRDANAKQGEMTDLLAAYFATFGDRPCCGGDLRLYLCSLDTTEADRFLEVTLQAIKFNDDMPDSAADINRHVCWHSMSRLIGKHHDKDQLHQREKLASELIALHKSCSAKFDQGYSSTVVRPYDNYLMLACHILWDLWQENGDDKQFWTSVFELHRALKASPASYNLRFLLIKFLNQSGAVGASSFFHAGLEIKHVQNDSLGYVLSRHIQTGGHFHTTFAMLNTSLKFFNSTYKDIIDFLISAYRCGSFDKVIEFINLRQRLSASQHYALLNVEQILLEILVESKSHSQAMSVVSGHQVDPDKDEIPWRDLTDNRDFKVMASWDPPEKCNAIVSDDLISESFMQDQRFLKYRSLLVRSLAASLYLAEGIQSAPKDTHYAGPTENGSCHNVSMRATLESLLGQLEHHHEEVMRSESNYKALLTPIQGPDRSRLTLYVESLHGPFLMNLIRAVLDSHESSEDSDPQEPLSKAFEQLKDMIASITTEQPSHSMKDREAYFEQLFNVIESASHMAIICGVCQRLTEPNLSKKSKKKPPTAVQSSNPRLSGVSLVIEKATESLVQLHTFLKSLESDCVKTIETQLSQLELADDKVELRTLMDESLKTTFFNLNSVLQAKIDYLKAL